MPSFTDVMAKAKHWVQVRPSFEGLSHSLEDKLNDHNTTNENFPPPQTT